MASIPAPAGSVRIRRKGTIVGDQGGGAVAEMLTALLPHPVSDLQLQRDLEVMAQRLAQTDARVMSSAYTLNDAQATVFADCAMYFRACAFARQNGLVEPFGRVILPPRTGKTVLMGEIIAGTGATTLILVPSAQLVEQHQKELQTQLPGTEIGVYYGGEKDIKRITVATYQIIQMQFKNGTLPHALRCVHLVFADEAHEGMSAERMNVQANAFFPSAARIAFTATPDYNERRVLADHYSKLIHELTAWEADKRGMLAKTKTWVLLVDEEQSVTDIVQPRIHGGDYDPDDIGKLMAAAPFLKACAVERFARPTMSTLICCASQFQAREMLAYLVTHHQGQGSYGLILDDTPRRERRALLDAFDRGDVDTLINVGILLRGWNSPRCKLLIDLALSLSQVRSTQKYYRPRTKDGDKEAHIVVLAPKHLEVIPYLPGDVFGAGTSEVAFPEEWRRKKKTPAEPGANAAEKKPPKKRKRSLIKGVNLVTSILVEGESVEVGMDPHDPEEIAEVVLSSYPEARTIRPSFHGFERRPFVHEKFTGNGLRLLRFCGIRTRRHGSYRRFMQWLFPDQAGAEFIGTDASLYTDLPTEADVEYLETAGGRKKLGQETLMGLELGRLALSPIRFLGPEEAYFKRELLAVCRGLLATLTPREEKVLTLRFGIGTPGSAGTDLEGVAAEFEVTRERIRQVEAKALRKLRHPSRSKFLRAFIDP